MGDKGVKDTRERKAGRDTDVTLVSNTRKEKKTVIENRLEGSEGGEQRSINY